MLHVAFLPWPDPSFPQRVDELRTLLGAPDNPLLFPSHFLKSAFPNLGGRIATVTSGSMIQGVAMLFPYRVTNDGREYVLRFHRITRETGDSEVVTAVRRALGSGVAFYDPSVPKTFATEPAPADQLEIVAPSESGARTIRELQHEIWRHERVDSLYPVDLHSNEFHSASSLRARIGDRTAGALFGFRKFGGTPLPGALRAMWNGELRLESQLMAVHPDFRRADIAFRLKLRQGELAQEEAIDIINWTFDPLQYANARLNLNRLGALAFDFRRNHYDFTNALNIVPASRLAVTWLPSSIRARAAREQALPEQAIGAETAILNDRDSRMAVMPRDRFAIEIPRDWNATQREERDLARRWRDVTDDILEELLGTGEFAVTGTTTYENRVYLTGERLTAELVSTLLLQPITRDKLSPTRGTPRNSEEPRN